MNTELLIAILMIGSGAAGYYWDRWVRRSRQTEDAQSIAQTIALRRMLAEEGLSFKEARELRDRFFSGREPITPAIARALVDQRVPEDEVPDDTLDFGQTTVEMVGGLAERLDALKVEIEKAMSDLMADASPTRIEAMRQAHQAWEEFAAREGDVAGLLFEGGSGAPILNLASQVQLAETRLNELRLMKAEEDAL
jgi:uncharacterized protein YecT (DUF1311 family)